MVMFIAYPNQTDTSDMRLQSYEKKLGMESPPEGWCLPGGW